ncbi:hypothetical protein Tco_0733424, partial [Tanacetum coccineum]
DWYWYLHLVGIGSDIDIEWFWLPDYVGYILLCVRLASSSFASFFTWILLGWFRLPASVYCLPEYVCLLLNKSVCICCCLSESAAICLNLISNDQGNPTQEGAGDVDEAAR